MCSSVRPVPSRMRGSSRPESSIETTNSVSAWNARSNTAVRWDRKSRGSRPRPSVQVWIAAKQPAEVWINPGAESPALVERARRLGLSPILACSMIGLADGSM